MNILVYILFLMKKDPKYRSNIILDLPDTPTVSEVKEIHAVISSHILESRHVL